MERWPEGIGRTVIIAGIAGALFIGFLAVTPRLTAANTTTAYSPPTTVASALPGISDPVKAVPVGPVDIQVTVTTEPTTAVEPIAVAPGDATTEPVPMDPALDGTIDLIVEASNATDADLAGILVEGDEIQWHFTVTNQSDEEIWGAYVYLELHGPAWCDEHNLKPGESSDCWIGTEAVEGNHTADAWATAWTIDRIVKATIDYGFEVSL